MRGASAVERLLEEYRDHRVRVLVVWEPVLWSDVAPPVNAVLARLSDSRVQQFWDPNRSLSRELASAQRRERAARRVDDADRGATPDRDATNRRNEATGEDREPDRSVEIVWDFAALYPAAVRWEDRIPEAAWQDGPVAGVIDGLRDHLTAMAR